MPVKIKSPEAKRLQRLIASYEAKLRAGFLAKVKEARAAVNLSQLAGMIERGEIEQALAVTLIIPEEINALSVAAVVAASKQAAKEIFAATGVDVMFDDVHANALRIMESRALQVATVFAQKQQDAIREVLLDGIRRGVNPRQQAIALRSSIGLTASQVKAVNNFRDMLETNDKEVLTRKLRDKRFDRTINRAIRADKVIAQDRIDKMVTRYRDRYVKYRANTIAQTEALSAVHQGKEEMFNHAVAMGHLERDRIENTWITVQDSRRRHHHATMQGQTRAFGERFLSGQGNLLLHPGDPSAPLSEIIHCRCIKVIVGRSERDFESPHRAGASDDERSHHVGENHHVAKWNDRQLRGCGLDVAGVSSHLPDTSFAFRWR